MPTIMTHAVVGLGLARIAAPGPMPPLYWGLAATLSMLPDIDVVAFFLGIPYGAPLGHRGFVHSLFCALLVTLAVALLSFQILAMPWWLLWCIFFVIMASHGLLDAFTNGGLGIALLAPFDGNRYFFRWRPVQVSPIGLSFLGTWGIRVMKSEIAWIWVPLACLVGGVELYRAAFGAVRLSP
jgi:inner membrane protein